MYWYLGTCEKSICQMSLKFSSEYFSLNFFSHLLFCGLYEKKIVVVVRIKDDMGRNKGFLYF